MKLHENNDSFRDLIALTSDWIGIPEARYFRSCDKAIKD